MSPQTQAPATADRDVSVVRNAGNSKNLSFAERAANNPKSPTSSTLTPRAVNGNRNMQDIDRPLPCDVRQPSKARSRADLAKQRSNIDFFEEAFAVTETNHVKERIYGDSMVLAEVKTNVIVRQASFCECAIGNSLVSFKLTVSPVHRLKTSSPSSPSFRTTCLLDTSAQSPR